MGAAYKEMYETLKKRITKKEYKIGELLPPEPELEKEFNVSRTTVRRAIAMLVQDGYITVKQGFGTQVVSKKTTQNLNKLTSISESLEQKGLEIGVKGYYIELVRAEPEQAKLLVVPVGTPLYCIHRIRMADGAPIGIVKNYIIASYVPNLEEMGEIRRLYQFLKEKFGITYTGAHDVIGACNASYEEAQLLDVAPKTALVTVRRVCSIKNRPVELDFVRLVASIYEYEFYFETQEK